MQDENLLRAEAVRRATKNSQLATATLLHDKLKENVARITWPLRRAITQETIAQSVYNGNI